MNPNLLNFQAECKFMGLYVPNLKRRVELSNGRVVSINLNGLDLGNFHHFPISILNFSELRELSLRYNNLGSLPDRLSKLHHLETLDVSHNKIKRVPKTLNQLHQLKYLNLRDNFITEMPDLSDLSNLIALDLSENSLGSVPSSIRELENLQRLYLANNYIHEIHSKQIQSLEQLYYINLRANQIELFDHTILSLDNISKINLYHNPIQWNMNQLDGIHTDMRLFLDNYSQQIKRKFPSNIKILKPKIFDYRDSIQHPPQFGVRAQGYPFNTVMFFGEENIGKSSLIETYVMEYFLPEKDLIITQNRYLDWDHFILQKYNQFYQIWYPHTQDKYDPSYNTSILNGFYYTNLVVFVFDVSNEMTFHILPKYINQLMGIRINSCPMIIVGNKSDKHYDSNLSRSTIKNYISHLSDSIGEHIQYIETSVTERTGIEQLFTTIFKIFNLKNTR